MARLAIHPGEHLQEELNELVFTPAEMAERLGITTDFLQAVLNGSSDVTADLALRLGHFFGTSAEFWLRLQNSYDLRLAEQDHGEVINALPTLKQFATV